VFKNNYDWDNQGNNATIKDVWGDLQAECTGDWRASGTLDLSALWNEIQSGIGQEMRPLNWYDGAGDPVIPLSGVFDRSQIREMTAKASFIEIK
jgi:hypothetical protein